MTEKSLEVHKEFKKLMNLLARYAKTNHTQNNKNGVTRSQALILEFIYEKTKDGEPVYQKDVEQHFSIRRSTATESMKRLEAQGLLTRKVSKLDARLKEITLSKKAIDFISKNHDCLTELTDVMCKGITQEETETIKTIIRKMQNNLKEHAKLDEKNI